MRNFHSDPTAVLVTAVTLFFAHSTCSSHWEGKGIRHSMQKDSDHRLHHPHYYHHLTQRRPNNSLSRQSLVKHSSSGSILSSQSQCEYSSYSLDRRPGAGELVTSKSTSSLSSRRQSSSQSAQVSPHGYMTCVIIEKRTNTCMFPHNPCITYFCLKQGREKRIEKLSYQA
jgi:hypothetical protein